MIKLTIEITEEQRSDINHGLCELQRNIAEYIENWQALHDMKNATSEDRELAEQRIAAHRARNRELQQIVNILYEAQSYLVDEDGA